MRRDFRIAALLATPLLLALACADGELADSEGHAGEGHEAGGQGGEGLGGGGEGGGGFGGGGQGGEGFGGEGQGGGGYGGEGQGGEGYGGGGQGGDGLPFELRIVSSGHYFKDTFLLGDTAWHIFQYTPAERKTYLDSRVALGFNMILGAPLCINWPDYKGNYNKTASKTDSAWYRNLDDIMQEVEDRGLWYYVPVAWGANAFSANTIFPNTQAAYDYGAWVADRYKHHKNLIWSPVNEWGEAAGADYMERAPYVNALAKGIKSVIPDARMTEHGEGRLDALVSSSTVFGKESWLTFNGIQTGSTTARLANGYKHIFSDFNSTPTKPTVLLEGAYEGGGADNSDAIAMRRQLWNAALSGAAGYGYGNHYVWRRREGWSSHLNDAGTAQMKHITTFLAALARPMSRVPDQAALVGANDENDYTARKTIMRDGQNKWMAVYLPRGGTVKLDTALLNGSDYTARWFNTSTGKFSSAGVGRASGPETFEASTSTDIVLLLEVMGG